MWADPAAATPADINNTKDRFEWLSSSGGDFLSLAPGMALKK
jgi:hypothetical protein